MKITRKGFLGAFASTAFLGLGSAVYMRLIEPSRLEVTKKKLQINSAQAPFRALHLSDFHRSKFVSLDTIRTAIEKGLNENPDIAFLTGDFITWTLEDQEAYAKTLRTLTDEVPTYACIGNHDGGRWAGSSHGYKTTTEVRSLLDESGIQLLFNQAKATNVNGHRLTIAGLGDLWAGDAKPELALKEKRNENDPIILLSHNPDSKELLKTFDWDLMLCGHTHGGQLVVPFLGHRPFLPVRDKRFAEGLHRWRNNKWIHITRGVGNLHGLRFNCRPEISLLEIS